MTTTVTVNQLIVELQEIAKQGGGDLMVVLSGDGEGNTYSQLTNDFSYGNFNEDDGEIDHIDAIDPDVNSVIFWPV